MPTRRLVQAPHQPSSSFVRKMLMATAASCVVDLVAADPSVLLLHLHTDAIILALQTRFLRMEELRELARDERERLALYI